MFQKPIIIVTAKSKDKVDIMKSNLDFHIFFILKVISMLFIQIKNLFFPFSKKKKKVSFKLCSLKTHFRQSSLELWGEGKREGKET